MSHKKLSFRPDLDIYTHVGSQNEQNVIMAFKVRAQGYGTNALKPQLLLSQGDIYSMIQILYQLLCLNNGKKLLDNTKTIFRY